MPWREISPMDERQRFLKAFRSRTFKFSELCAFYGVSRKTGYKWLNRFWAEGPAGLQDRRRTPHSCPHHTPRDVEVAILHTRQKHPDWGAVTILQYLERERPNLPLPAISTASEILKRNGLPRRRRRRNPGHPGLGTTFPSRPNAVWTADFKGQFKTLNGYYCFPLTILDGFSRFCLACQGLTSTEHELAQPAFERVFCEFGLPEAIRTDNGAPFATQAIRRLSRLHVWWIKLGITPELILPARPDQNGRHERFHLTLKRRTALPPRSSLASQQLAFDDFIAEYNTVRPHQALDGKTPGSIYTPSLRPFPHRLPPILYPRHYETRLVGRDGHIHWGCGHVMVTHVLEGEYVGLEEVDNEIWSLYFGPLLLGRFHERELNLHGTYAYNKPA